MPTTDVTRIAAVTPGAITPLERVNAGDLITAVYMNRVIEAVNQLQTRVTAIEQGTQPSRGLTLTSITGTTDPIRVGTRITLKGKNFVEPAALNTVTIGGVTVPMQAFIGGNDTELTLDVPNIPGLAAGGTVVPVIVSNANGEGTLNVAIVPQLVLPSGTIQVGYVEAPADALIAVGKTYTFFYEIRASATLEARYVVQPTITGPTDWTVQTSQGELTIPSDLARGVVRRVPISVRVGSPTPATLNVSVTAPGTAITPNNAQAIAIRPGEPPPTPDNRVRLTLSSPAPRAADNRLVATRNTELTVTFFVAVNEIGENYEVNPVMRDATGWRRSGPDIKKFNVTTVPDQKIVTVGFTPDATARNTDLVFTVTRGTSINAQSSIGVSIA